MQTLRPIRKSRNYWEIPIYTRHECNDGCSSIQLLNETAERTEYLPAQCNLENVYENAFVKLSEFDLSDPETQGGALGNRDFVAIPTRSFEFLIDFPLFRPARIPVKLTTDGANDGTTVWELIYALKGAYERVYAEEEETTTPIRLVFNKRCGCSPEHALREYTGSVSEPCSICYSETPTDVRQLPCNHIFHKECILSWITSGENNERRKTCPLCRAYVGDCPQCNGSGMISLAKEFKVVPPQYRLWGVERNTTDGKFGIYSYDFERLILKSFVYNRTTNTVYPVMQPDF